MSAEDLEAALDWVRGEIPAAGEAHLRFLGAGIDPDNRAFKGALQEALTASDDAGGDTLDLSGLSLTGVVDVEVNSHFDVAGTALPSSESRIFLRGNDLRTDDLLLEGIVGVLERKGDVLSSPRLAARLTGHPVILRDVRVSPMSRVAELGEIDPLLMGKAPTGHDPGLVALATIDATDYPLDAEHLALLTNEPLEGEPTDQDWSGRVDVQGAQVFLARSEATRNRLVLRGPMTMRGVSLRFALPIEIDVADVQLEQLVVEHGGVRAWAKISGLDGRLAGRRLQDASMVLGFVDKRLTIDDLNGAFVGGRMRSLGSAGPGSRKALGVDLTSPHRFDMAIEMQDVDVGRLLQGMFESSIADEGRLQASLQLAGTPADILALTGQGSIRLEKGRLWSIPAARELFSSLGFRNTAVFNELRARFELRDGEIQTHFVTVKSALLNLVGKGWHDLDGRLGYDLDVRTGLFDRLGIFNRLIYWLSGNLIHVAVRGDQSRPEVLMRSSLLELFRGRPPEPSRQLPLPDFAPLGRRF